MTEPKDPEAFSDPKIAINRVYTKHGDAGETRLVGGQTVPKTDARIEAYGTVDELNAFVGAARQTAMDAAEKGGTPLSDPAAVEHLSMVLRRVQHDLFNLGSLLATLPADVHEKQARVTDADVAFLEQEIDRCQAVLAPLRSFVLPGGSRLNIDLHVARTVCRRAERLVVGLVADGGADPVAVRYLNRLSDAFFVWSRYVAKLLATPEVLWDPNHSRRA